MAPQWLCPEPQKTAQHAQQPVQQETTSTVVVTRRLFARKAGVHGSCRLEHHSKLSLLGSKWRAHFDASVAYQFGENGFPNDDTDDNPQAHHNFWDLRDT